MQTTMNMTLKVRYLVTQGDFYEERKTMRNKDVYTLTKITYDNEGNVSETVLKQFSEDFLDGVLRNIGDFIRGCSFVIDPFEHLIFVNEKELFRDTTDFKNESQTEELLTEEMLDD